MTDGRVVDHRPVFAKPRGSWTRGYLTLWWKRDGQWVGLVEHPTGPPVFSSWADPVPAALIVDAAACLDCWLCRGKVAHGLGEVPERRKPPP